MSCYCLSLLCRPLPLDILCCSCIIVKKIGRPVKWGKFCYASLNINADLLTILNLNWYGNCSFLLLWRLCENMICGTYMGPGHPCLMISISQTLLRFLDLSLFNSASSRWDPTWITSSHHVSGTSTWKFTNNLMNASQENSH